MMADKSALFKALLARGVNTVGNIKPNQQLINILKSPAAVNALSVLSAQ